MGVTPNYRGNKNNIPDNASYADAQLTTSIKVGGTSYYNAYFAEDYKVRVAKPSVATTGGGTSYVKNTTQTTGDIYDITSGKDNNFVGTSVADNGSTAISSSAGTVTDTSVIDSINQTNSDYKDAATSSIVMTGDPIKSQTGFKSTDTYNDIANVYRVKNTNVTIDNTFTAPAVPTTYIVEG